MVRRAAYDSWSRDARVPGKASAGRPETPAVMLSEVVFATIANAGSHYFPRDYHNPTRVRGTHEGRQSRATLVYPSLTFRVVITSKRATSKRTLLVGMQSPISRVEATKKPPCFSVARTRRFLIFSDRNARPNLAISLQRREPLRRLHHRLCQRRQP